MKWIVRALIIVALMAVVSLGWYAAEQTGFTIGSGSSGMAGGEEHAAPTGMGEREFTGEYSGGSMQSSFSSLLSGMGSSLLEILAVIAVVVIVLKGFAWVGSKVKKTSTAASH